MIAGDDPRADETPFQITRVDLMDLRIPKPLGQMLHLHSADLGQIYIRVP